MTDNQRGRGYTKLCHSSCRVKVCVFCFKKAQRALPDFHVKEFEKLKDDLDFSLNDSKTPSGICNSCRLRKFKGPFTINDLIFKDFSFIIPNDDPTTCSCELCKVAKGSKLNQQGVGRPRISPQFRSATLDTTPSIRSWIFLFPTRLVMVALVS